MTRGASRAEAIARILHGSWRKEPTAPTGPRDAGPAAAPISMDELAHVSPLLLKTGAGALAWKKLRQSEIHLAAVAKPLHAAYRLHALEARRQAMRLEEAASILADIGVEPLLAKGWAVARWYPEPALRPYGDHDLFVPPDRFDEALHALGGPSSSRRMVDLHAGAPEGTSGWSAAFARSERVGIGAATIRVLGPEDQLRLLCLHFLRHGGWRPLWLVDIGAGVEARPDGFDWDRFLGADGRTAGVDTRTTEACTNTLLLAHRLLGADLSGTPLATAPPPPRWLAAAVLRAWETGGHYMHTPPIALTRPSELLGALRARWPNPIEATVRRGGRFDDGPRLPLQAADTVSRLIDFLASETGALLRRRGSHGASKSRASP